MTGKLFENRIRIRPRRPGQAKRDPGPITTAVNVARRAGRHCAHHSDLWLWVPAFRGDDELRLRHLVPSQ
jgi:hypothetical protein